MGVETSGSIAVEPLAAQKRAGLVQGAVIVVAWLVATLLFGFYLFWIWPQTLGNQQSTAWLHLSGGDSWRIAGTALLWVSSSLVAVGFEVFRLRAEERWALDYPYSPWRTVKSVALVVGWIGICSYIVNATISSVLFTIPGFAPTPNPGYALAGPFAAVVGLTMVLIDINRGERRDRHFHPQD